MTVQSNFSAIPVRSSAFPPEGRRAARFQYILTTAQPNIATIYQLNSQSGLTLSQVVTLCIDNTSNAYPLDIVHGALNETLTVPAFATMVVPTFSNDVNYVLNVSAAGGITPRINLQFNVILLNYPRAQGSFSNTLTSAISGTGQNTKPLFSGLFQFSGFFLGVVLPPGSYILDSLDVALEGFQASAAGTCQFSFQVTPDFVTSLVDMDVNFNAPNGNWNSGHFVTRPAYLSWPTGLRQVPELFLFSSTIPVNLTSAVVRVNLSGIGAANP